MLLLTSTSDLIQLVTSSTATTEVQAAWVDNASGTITPGRTNTAISTATTTTVVGSPGASTQRSVRSLIVRNDHASSSQDIELRHTDGTTVVTIFKCTLLAGEQLTFDDAIGFQKYTAGGLKAQGAITGPPDIQIFYPGGPLGSTWTKPTSFTPKVVIVELIGGGRLGRSRCGAV